MGVAGVACGRSPGCRSRGRPGAGQGHGAADHRWGLRGGLDRGDGSGPTQPPRRRRCGSRRGTGSASRRGVGRRCRVRRPLLARGRRAADTAGWPVVPEWDRSPDGLPDRQPRGASQPWRRCLPTVRRVGQRVRRSRIGRWAVGGRRCQGQARRAAVARCPWPGHPQRPGRAHPRQIGRIGRGGRCAPARRTRAARRRSAAGLARIRRTGRLGRDPARSGPRRSAAADRRGRVLAQWPPSW